LFSLINYARFLKINPDNALELTNQKFIKRFEFIESKAKELEKKLSDMSLSEMETIWKEAKNQSSSSDSNNC
jgi:XTP/dITP diphosphohydrolase